MAPSYRGLPTRNIGKSPSRNRHTANRRWAIIIGSPG
jgi:hypothetical protein